MSDKSDNGNSRRAFLKLMSVSAPAAAAAVAMSPDEAAAAEEEIVYGETRLRSTRHTREYFQSARY